MNLLILSSAVLVLLVTAISALDLFFGIRSMTRLKHISPFAKGRKPRISIIVPACNEEKNIQRAILSQLQQEYDNLEVIAINDRSTDSTGIILDTLESEHENLKVRHIQDLPEGWMGKANAMQQGALLADGEYLLFTDADIIMEESTLARAAQYMKDKSLDHLALIFKNISPGWLLNSLILESGAGLIQLFRPWRARKPKAPNFIGVGAFNMVKKETYFAVGGHEHIRMHPIDDIMLGKIIKRSGYRQECLLGIDLVAVPWYGSVGQMVDGLMKNVLAIINYRFGLLIPLLIGMIFLNILPFWAMLFTEGYTQWIWSVIVFIKLGSFYYGTRLLEITSWCTVGTLLTPYISLYIVLRAAWLNYREHGIYWRGTHYSIEKLRANEPILP
jgi:glycosyltransferase involved in cell wall biosynthesis